MDRVGQVWFIGTSRRGRTFVVVVGGRIPSPADVWWDVVFLEDSAFDHLLEEFARPWEKRVGFMRRVT